MINRVECDEDEGVQYGYFDSDCSEESKANDSSAYYPLDECEFYREVFETQIYFTMGQCFKNELLVESSLCENDTSDIF